jgi:hypothetical protein
VPSHKGSGHTKKRYCRGIAHFKYTAKCAAHRWLDGVYGALTVRPPSPSHQDRPRACAIHSKHGDLSCRRNVVPAEGHLRCFARPPACLDETHGVLTIDRSNLCITRMMRRLDSAWHFAVTFQIKINLICIGVS